MSQVSEVQDVQEAIILCGQVKWFDPTKGFGFVVANEGGADILLHANVLRNFGQSSVADGSEIEVEVQATMRGRQATAVLAITPPESEGTPQLEEMSHGDADISAAGPAQPARVKWFDKAKGFGFANVFGSDEDVFIHVEVLRRSGLADLQPGEAVSIRTTEGKRGCMAVVVAAWDTELSQNT